VLSPEASGRHLSELAIVIHALTRIAELATFKVCTGVCTRCPLLTFLAGMVRVTKAFSLGYAVGMGAAGIEPATSRV
jgi:hypothetical protein